MLSGTNSSLEPGLYVAALPIGNAEDITQRARNILSLVDVIAAEDTRKFKTWINFCGLKINAKIITYHSYNEIKSAEGIVKLIKEDKSVALVSDAGTPRISDPGYNIVRKCHENGILVVSIPGASSVTAFLSVSPLPVSPFLFLGFITPKEKKRLNFLNSFSNYHGAVVFFESVHRIKKLLASILEAWGNLEVFIGREITKKNEEFFWGYLDKAILWAENKKGEFIIQANKRKC
ncbi:MAG: 16S rRNA (cytidine(1402)-2'-O)-methyltransferase [Spirochaetia bacterium]|nr:16S rRNA (cytidine(1402)-2'-O)-methyltransferase [Spirochaetia bacterium]